MAPKARHYSQELVDQMNELLNRGGVAAITILGDALDLLAQHNISYELREAKVELFLVHKKNRGGLLINPYNSHRNLCSIVQCGANEKELHSSVAFELPPSGHPWRQDLE